MAYTYNDFISAATGAKLLDKFSESDLNVAKSNPEYGFSMLKLQQDEMNATTAEQKVLAQEAANQLRQTYGSFTPSAGAGASGSGGGFVYDQQDEYQKLLDSVMNPQPFEYDHTLDPQYSAYKKGYLREADRAREDTLAKVSASSGGDPSSFAVTAASQAGDYYNGQLNDVVPTLYQNAYQRYLNDAGLQQNALAAMENDRNFDYGVYLQQLEQEQAALDQKQQEFANALALYQTLGYATPEVAAILGIGGGAIEGGGTVSGDSGGGGGSGGSGEYTDSAIPSDVLGQLRQLYPDGNVTNPKMWNQLVNNYGADALSAAGYRMTQAAQAPANTANAPAGAASATPGLNNGLTKNKVVTDAVIDGTVKGNAKTAGTSTGMNGGAWNTAKSTMAQLVSSGDRNNAMAYLQSVAGKVSDQQGIQLADMLKKAGMA